MEPMDEAAHDSRSRAAGARTLITVGAVIMVVAALAPVAAWCWPRAGLGVALWLASLPGALVGAATLGAGLRRRPDRSDDWG